VSTRNKLIIVAALVLAFLVAAGSTRAQSAAALPPPPGGGDVFYIAGDLGPGPMGPPEIIDFVGIEAEPGGKAVAGAPFTASFSTQTSQTLSDGNHIQRSSTGTLARDSHGRTRRDMTLSAIGPLATSGKPKQVSMINDPVAGTHYILDPDKKIAHQLGPHGGKGKGRKHGGPGGPDWVSRSDDGANVTTTSLGTQTISGVVAEGTRTTRTIPVGAMGNERPIVITVERWYSTDLQTVVKTTRSDPFMGDKVTQLTDIKRAEPDASFFRVPADYSVKKGGAKGTHRIPAPPAD